MLRCPPRRYQSESSLCRRRVAMGLMRFGASGSAYVESPVLTEALACRASGARRAPRLVVLSGFLTVDDRPSLHVESPSVTERSKIQSLTQVWFLSIANRNARANERTLFLL
ncbi:hypothetical protein F1559_000420 [Cyanidiococcus yangmingshanensis]|uniref:Uncharacterized protein n=1 Tax=Cyanidiococcus yangmingshanensis TaxID=2690220 RepID=A0A7J7IQU2_9RHOD|nr:hypothetical protein F1559_000420 [Cyanidiococcus yangmingshanensis]